MEFDLRHRNGTFLLLLAVVVLLLSRPANAAGPASLASSYTGHPSVSHHIKGLFLHLGNPLSPSRNTFWNTSWLSVGMVTVTATCGIGTLLYQWSKRKGKNGSGTIVEKKKGDVVDDTKPSDPGLLKKFSTIREYTVPSTGFTYPEIRTFYRPHHQADKLPRKPCPIPLLVFVHGLGGSISQFHSVMMSLVNLAPTLAIDLPGCGGSSFAPRDWAAYTTDALVQLLAVAIEAHRDRDAGQGVILVAHSMGCSLAALLASSTSPHAALLSEHVLSLVAICPQAYPPDEKHAQTARKVCSLPAPVFDLFRKWDRRGGNNSASVLRMTGPDADEETKKLQRRFNQQSRTQVWQRMMYGMIPSPETGGGLPGREIWAGLQIPLFLLGGDADTVTPAENVKIIVSYLGRDVSAVEPPSEKASLPIAAAPFDPSIVDPDLVGRKHQDSGIDTSDLPRVGDDTTLTSTSSRESMDAHTVTDAATATGDSVPTLSENNSPASETKPSLSSSTTFVDAPDASSSSSPFTPHQNVSITPIKPNIAGTTPSPHPRKLLVKTTIFPKPAAHSLVFSPSTSRILSGLLATFFSEHIDPRLSLGWQLQYLTTEGKWEVKNLEKWKAVQPVSNPIAHTFRAMKTLREVDERHSPKIFVKEYAGKIAAVVDISHDSPVYDPRGLEEGGIRYYKFPTVSKLPPLKEEVVEFIALVERVRNELGANSGLIGVHCHYGFNRTGFFLVCYMVEKLGYRVEDAIEEFRIARPPGIRHAHFIDALHVMYCVGLKKAPTL